MNWETWSRVQAEQILELRQRIKALRKRVRLEHARAELWRSRALREREVKR